MDKHYEMSDGSNEISLVHQLQRSFMHRCSGHACANVCQKSTGSVSSFDLLFTTIYVVLSWDSIRVQLLSLWSAEIDVRHHDRYRN